MNSGKLLSGSNSYKSIAVDHCLFYCFDNILFLFRFFLKLFKYGITFW